ncbi:Uncharacterized protein TCM_033758 [Theobroma cacao]|uniref:Uncharacterized protein n=1 Tax=Theobroma cacao TaxID=3641 RepID=A0A061FBE6_THECC|nr:Uncharacterized protein TCM_033758 [Theobroma cacao]
MTDSMSSTSDLRSSTSPIEDPLSFLLALSIQNKSRFIDGSIPEPDVSDKLFVPCTRCNSLILAWLLESISPPIASTVFYIRKAYEVWETLKERFSQPDDARICNLQFNLYNISQGTRSVDAYFTELNCIWEELRNYRPLPHCSCGICNSACFQTYIDQYQKDSVFRFLNGLNESFSALRSQILMMKPFPSLNKAYNLVIRDESQRNLYLHTMPIIESSAMATMTEGKVKSKVDVVCSYCHKKGHTKDKCYRLIGFPPDFKFLKGKSPLKKGNVWSINNVGPVTSKEECDESTKSLSSLTLSKHQIQKLMSLINDHIADGENEEPTNPP